MQDDDSKSLERVRFPPPPPYFKDLDSPGKAELGSSSAQLCQERQLEGSAPPPPTKDGQQVGGDFCEGCPPDSYPTDKTRCTECPRRRPAANKLAELRDRRDRFAAADMWSFAYAADCAIKAIEEESNTVRYECNSCDWTGPREETVHPKHWPDNLLYPECHETTEVSP